MENKLINLKQGRDKNWPFSDPRYVPKIQHEEYTVIRDGVKITRIKVIDNNPSQLPEYAARAIYSYIPQRPEYFLRNSPLTKPRKSKDGKRGKQVEIRPRAKRVFTKLAVTLIKEGHIKSLINPVSHKIKHGYLKTIKQLPARLQVKKDTFEI